MWDLGSIAMNGGLGARALFREVLVASASVPGLFPPVVIRVQEQQALYEEVHVDGTATVPFFVPPAFFEPPRDARDDVAAGDCLHHCRWALERAAGCDSIAHEIDTVAQRFRGTQSHVADDS